MPLPKILLHGDARLAAFPETPQLREGAQAIVGWREWVGLPGLGIARVMAKMDTGARTSALHANSIEPFEADGSAFVRFDVMGEAENVPLHEAPIADRRLVRSSNGETEGRFVIRTALIICGSAWPIEVTLTNRERMELPMLIGREALAGRVLVDAEHSWLCGRPQRRPETLRAKAARVRRRLTGERP